MIENIQFNNLTSPVSQQSSTSTFPNSNKLGQNNLKKFLHFVFLFLILLIGAKIILFDKFTNITSPFQQEIKETSAPLVNSNNITSVQSNIPLGYVAKETLCYTIIIPKNNDAGDENNCDLSYGAYIDTPTTKSLSIHTGISSEWHEYNSSQDMAQKWISSTKNKDDNIISQGDIKVGAYNGYQVLVKSTVNRLQSNYVFIYIPNRYTVHSYSITGFNILATFSDTDNPENVDAQKAEFNRLLSSWQWK
jgi:hypothetical protein